MKEKQSKKKERNKLIGLAGNAIRITSTQNKKNPLSVKTSQEIDNA